MDSTRNAAEGTNTMVLRLLQGPGNGAEDTYFPSYTVRLPDGTTFTVGSSGPRVGRADRPPQDGDGPPGRAGEPIPWNGYEPSRDFLDSVLVQPRMSFRDANNVLLGEATSSATFVVRLPLGRTPRNTGNPLRVIAGSRIVDQPYWFPSLRLGRVWPQNGYYNRFAASYYADYVDRLDDAVRDDEGAAALLRRMRADLNYHDSFNWSLVVVMTAMLHPHPNDYAALSAQLDHGQLPGPDSVRRAVRLVLGPHGLASGWTRSMPNVAYMMLMADGHVPRHWCPDQDSDGGSSYDSDSPGDEVVVGDEWMARVSDSSSYSSDDEPEPNRRLHVLKPQYGLLQTERKHLKDFDAYASFIHVCRRGRCKIRRTRRDTRLCFCPQRRKRDPCYDEEAKIAETMAAERAHEQLVDGWLANRTKAKRACKKFRDKRVSDAWKSHATEHPIAELTRQRFDEFRNKLSEQVFTSWKRYYSSSIDEPLHLRCWMSPVRWVQQTGPK